MSSEPITTSRQKHSSKGALVHVTAAIAQLLERGVMPWRAPWDAARALAATPGLPLRINGLAYRGANVALLWAMQLARGYKRRTWLTFRQTVQMQAHVRKGEKACPIIFYGTATPKSEGDRSNDTENSNPSSYRFLKLFHVFNVEQCEGLDPPVEPPPPSPESSALHAWVTAAGARIHVGGDKAFYAPSIDTIHMPSLSSFLSEEHWAATLAHEAIHFTGHSSRLDRLSDFARDKKARAREELTAELGAAIIGAMSGLAPFHLEDHAAYIADWLTIVREEPKAFFAAGAKAQRAVDWLIEHAGAPPGP